MKDAQDLNDVLPYAIDGEVRQSWENQFARIGLATDPPAVRKRRQQMQALYDDIGHAVGRLSIVGGNMLGDPCQIPNRAWSPAKTHHS
jgi:hypothetical protein